MMYIFLNYDCIGKLKDTKNEGKVINRKDIKESVLRLANSFARKFENTEDQKKNEYFSRYCSTRFKKLIDLKSSLNMEELSEIQEILDVYDKMYYSIQPQNDTDEEGKFEHE